MAGSIEEIEPGCGRFQWVREAGRADRVRLQNLAFSRMGYDEKLDYCCRPEELPESEWDDIWPDVNRHLGTDAHDFEQLVAELGQFRFGRVPIVADTFCGGGSIPFEAARLGCGVHASDLNPVAAMLTWGALNIVGGSEELARRIRDAQIEVASAVRGQIDELRIETGTDGWRGKVYLYCLEIRYDGWTIPLAPNWIISATHRVTAKLIPDEVNKRFEIEIVKGASQDEMEAAQARNLSRRVCSSSPLSQRADPAQNDPWRWEEQRECLTPVDPLRFRAGFERHLSGTPLLRAVDTDGCFREQNYCRYKVLLGDGGRPQTRATCQAKRFVPTWRTGKREAWFRICQSSPVRKQMSRSELAAGLTGITYLMPGSCLPWLSTRNKSTRSKTLRSKVR